VGCHPPTGRATSPESEDAGLATASFTGHSPWGGGGDAPPTHASRGIPSLDDRDSPGWSATRYLRQRGEVMTERSIDELGPVDYLVVEFPAGQQNFTGEAAEQLLRLHDSGIIRVMDLVLIGKGDDGTVMAQELGDLESMGEFERLETELAETLAEDDVLRFGAVMEPGSLGAVLVYENLWAAPLGSAIRRAGGQLVTNGRIPVQAIIAAVDADEAALVAEGV
jgi:hypothetical protein